ncbi:pentapeptide repeat-containing protein [Coleofasciculus sp. G2-EDA-02]|uniref:pentapeptide repeat-containing protein n=1 Tax=Coleofasciculus sp. G2-EDA-02 TaxID=3069529 RepID=UPI0032FE5B0E
MTDEEKISSSELQRRHEAGERNFQGVNLEKANLEGYNLEGANLEGAILEGANLHRANLHRANLQKTNLRGAILEGAILEGANLHRANLYRANLLTTRLQGANLQQANLKGAILLAANLEGANLEGANLEGANLLTTSLQRANLEKANLEGANLQGADLSETLLNATQAIATNFSNTTLTGACIQDWNINSSTNFNGVSCEYVYLKYNKETKIRQERRPHTGTFAPREFTQLFQISLNTVDLIFREGVNWQAIAYSLTHTLIINEDTPLAVQNIENKGDGTVIIRVQAPPNTDKEKIYKDFWQGYEFAQKAVESQDRVRLEDKDKEINRLFFLCNQLMVDSKKYTIYGNGGSIENDDNIASGT